MSALDGIRTVDELELELERVFVRVDFNVPQEDDGSIGDDERIRAALPTLRHVVERGGRLILASHLGRPRGPDPKLSLEPCAARLSELTGWEVHLPDDCIGDAPKKVIGDLREGQVCLLENLRFHAGEEGNDEGFARELAALASVYVNDAFGAAHRAHASVHALPRMMPARAMGFLLKQEVKTLSALAERPERPYVAVLGGAKVSDKIAVLERLIERCDALCIGGAMANTFLSARGLDLAASKVEKDQLALARTLLEKAEARGVEALLPTDLVVASSKDATLGRAVAPSAVPSGHLALDVGPATVERFAQRIANARTVFWNGPMGLFENPAFAAGTHGVARALAASGAFSVVGGGDSAAAVKQMGPELVSKIGFVSTGGGAALELLEGRKLPGVEALRMAG
jgi:phosphoglycerate kinase